MPAASKAQKWWFTLSRAEATPGPMARSTCPPFWSARPAAIWMARKPSGNFSNATVASVGRTLLCDAFEVDFEVAAVGQLGCRGISKGGGRNKAKARQGKSKTSQRQRRRTGVSDPHVRNVNFRYALSIAQFISCVTRQGPRPLPDRPPRRG